MKKGVGGVDVCRLAADATGQTVQFVYQCIETYMQDFALPALLRGSQAVIPGLGWLKIVSRKATNRHNVITRRVQRIPAMKTPTFKASKQVMDLINDIDSPKKRLKRLITLDIIEEIALKIESSLHAVHRALHAWADAALIVIKCRNRVFLPTFGTLKVTDMCGSRWGYDFTRGKKIAIPERYKLNLQMKPNIRLLFR